MSKRHKIRHPTNCILIIFNFLKTKKDGWGASSSCVMIHPSASSYSVAWLTCGFLNGSVSTMREYSFWVSHQKHQVSHLHILSSHNGPTHFICIINRINIFKKVHIQPESVAKVKRPFHVPSSTKMNIQLFWADLNKQMKSSRLKAAIIHDHKSLWLNRQPEQGKQCIRTVSN